MVWNKEMFHRNFFNFVLDYAIRFLQVNQKCLKLNGTHYPLFYVVGVSMSGGSEHNLKKNWEKLLMASKDNGMEIISDKSTCMVKCRDKTAGQCRNIKIDIISWTAERIQIFGNKLKRSKCYSGIN